MQRKNLQIAPSLKLRAEQEQQELQARIQTFSSLDIAVEYSSPNATYQQYIPEPVELLLAPSRVILPIFYKRKKKRRAKRNEE